MTELARDQDEEGDEAVEREKLFTLSRAAKGRVCPNCGRPTLVRRKRPLYLRVLQPFGLDIRTYQCAMCGSRKWIRQET